MKKPGDKRTHDKKKKSTWRIREQVISTEWRDAGSTKREIFQSDADKQNFSRPRQSGAKILAQVTHLTVRVDALGDNAPVLIDIDHRQRRPSAVATLIVGGVARHQLLLGKRDHVVPGKVPRPFEATGRTERPAGSAVCLVQTSISMDKAGTVTVVQQ